MSLTAQELSQLRGQLSDDQILQGLQHTSPEDAPDIGDLQKAGLNSTQILDGLSRYNSENQSSSSSWLDTLGNFGKAIKYGASQALSGAAETEGDLGFNQAAGAEKGLANALNPGDYDPASAHVSALDPSTWSYVPRAIAESLPDTAGGLASDALGGAIGGVPGALLAGGAYWLNRVLGQNARSRAAARQSSTVSNDDLLAALPGSALEAGLNTVGLRSLGGEGDLLETAPIKGAGASAVGQSALNVAKAAGTNAATGAASSVAGDLGAGNPDVNTTAALNAGLMGGAAGAAEKAVTQIPQLAITSRLSNGDANAKQQVADDFNSDRIAGDPDNPDDNDRMLASAGTLYRGDIANNLKDLRSASKTLQQQGMDSSAPDAQIAQTTDLLTNLKNGVLDPSQMATAQKSLPPDLYNNISKLNELNRLSQSLDGQPPGTTVYDKLRLAHVMSHYLPWAAGGATAAAAFHNPVWTALTAAPFIYNGLARAKRIALGENDPVGTFVSRFGGLRDAQGSSQGPAVPTSPQPTPQTPDPAQQPLQGQLLPPERPAGLLSPPPITGFPSARMYGDGFTMDPASSGYEGSGPSPYRPQALPPPEQPQAPQAPMRALPAPSTIYGPESQPPAGLPFLKGQGFTMQRAPSVPAPEAPAAPQQEATVAPRPAPAPAVAPRPVSHADQAEALQAQIDQAQSVIRNENADPQAKALARAALVKASVDAANLSEASRGVGKKGGGHGHGAHGPKAHAPKGGKVVEPKSVTIKTPHVTRQQAVDSIRRSPEAIGAGMTKRAGAREEIVANANHLNLSAAGQSALAARAPDLLQQAHNNASTRTEGKAQLNEFLTHFNEGDKAKLAEHFANAKATNGLRYLDSWKYKDAADKQLGKVRDLAAVKRKATKANK